MKRVLVLCTVLVVGISLLAFFTGQGNAQVPATVKSCSKFEDQSDCAFACHCVWCVSEENCVSGSAEGPAAEDGECSTKDGYVYTEECKSRMSVIGIVFIVLLSMGCFYGLIACVYCFLCERSSSISYA